MHGHDLSHSFERSGNEAFRQRDPERESTLPPPGFSSAVWLSGIETGAFGWLEEAISQGSSALRHSRHGRQSRSFGDDLREFRVVMIGNEWSADHKSPKSLGGKNDADRPRPARGRRGHRRSLWKRATSGRGTSCRKPEISSTATAPIAPRDPEGHIWTFGVTKERMTAGRVGDKASGLTTKKRLD